MNYCAGFCLSMASYHHKHPHYVTRCECCKELKMKVMYIAMQCKNNRVRIVSRSTVKSCKCQLCCGNGGGAGKDGKEGAETVDNGCANGRPLAKEV